MNNQSHEKISALTLGDWSDIASVIALFGIIFAFWQILVNRGQWKTMQSELSLLSMQVQDLLEARKGKIFKLKRAVRSLYDACQNVPSPPEIDKDEILNFNINKLAAIEASCDAFFFREVVDVPDLSNSLEELDAVSQDAQDDIIALSKLGPSATDTDLIAAAEQLKVVYRLAGKCDELLSQL